MGCGASVHAQGSLPLTSGLEEEAGKETSRSIPPNPIAEDAQAANHPEVKNQCPPNGGAEASTLVSIPTPSTKSDILRLQQQLPSTAPETPVHKEFEDALSPVAASENASSSSSACDEYPKQPATQLQSPTPTAPPLQQPLKSVQSSSLPEATWLMLNTTSSSSLEACDGQRPMSLSTPVTSSGVFDPAFTPSSHTATVILLPPGPEGPVGACSRYTDESDLSIASHSYDLDGCGGDDSDDDEITTLFTLQSWKRYYDYNKRKPQDLLTYFWRHFPPQDFSCFCLSYRNQELFLTSYMAENCMHGYCARLEDLGLRDEVFLRMYVLQSHSGEQYYIVGLLVVAGQALPPQLASLSAFDGFVYHHAETNRSLVRQFVSALLMGVSPLHSLRLISGREVR